MPGVDLRLEHGLALLEGELAPFLAEYAPPEHAPGTAHGYQVVNPMYGSFDGQVLYAIVRHLKPMRIVELGAGWSTLAIADAAARNAAEGAPVAHAVFDPYPAPMLERADTAVKVEPVAATEVPRDRFAHLEHGDILFIDTTHTVKPGSDVVHLLLEVLPSLAPGVVVHVHDFFRPFEYPKVLFERFGVFWQEHYLLQAFLAFNTTWEVLLANHALARLFPRRVGAVVPRFDWDPPPSALWLRRAM